MPGPKGEVAYYHARYDAARQPALIYDDHGPTVTLQLPDGSYRERVTWYESAPREPVADHFAVASPKRGAGVIDVAQLKRQIAEAEDPGGAEESREARPGEAAAGAGAGEREDGAGGARGTGAGGGRSQDGTAARS